MEMEMELTHFFYNQHISQLAFVETVQRKERDEKVELLTHQTWSGANLVDRMVTVASGGQSSTAAMGAGVTEKQF